MRAITFGEKTLVMGIINVTPDSFYVESRSLAREKAVERAIEFAESGADVVDIGGVSTRPGSEGIGLNEELERVIPVVDEVRKKSDVLISVDTFRPEVARHALETGADIINDISGLSYNNSLENIVANFGAHIVLMHIRGKPADMQEHAEYVDVVKQVSGDLDISIEKALLAGIDKSKIIIDPGIGFAKLAGHSLSLLKHLPVLKQKGYPVLVGLSRKSFIGAFTGLETKERLTPTIAANAISIFQGADIIRVHDVVEAVITAKISDALKTAQ